MINTLLVAIFAAACTTAGCTFKAPDANQPLGCACDARPNAYAYCKYDACTYAGCRSGFFDLDGVASNGCEADRSALSGNLVASFGRDYHQVSWYSETDDYFDVQEGIVSATVSDPTCTPTIARACDLRLEAFQISAARNTVEGDDGLSDVVIGITAPLTGTQRQGGAFFDNLTSLSASFGIGGRRTLMGEATGWVNVLTYPAADGTVEVSINAQFDGYIDDRKGTLQFGASGKTRQLFDASVPDARPRDGSLDGDATSEDATSEASGTDQ